MRFLPKRLKKRYLAALLLAPPIAWWAALQPSNHRDWTRDTAILPWAEVRGDSVWVHNVRNAVHFSADSFALRHDDRAYDLRELERAWFLVEPFEKDWRGPAHTLASFEFEGGEYLAVSVEVRKEKGETYSLLKGVLKRFELTYVVADERDVIALRTNHRRDDVYLYPIRAPREKVRAMLLDMLGRANELREHPEFYNTLTNSCTTTLAAHVNRVSPRRVPWSWKVVVPGYSDRLAYDLGLIDTDLPFEAARERFYITDKAQRAAGAPDFSARIRQLD